ncbi:MAG TPA: aspartate ammonia-lyase [Bacillota bacterium]
MTGANRQEHDLLGTCEVPADAYYGVHACRAAANFPISGQTPHPQLLRAMGLVKKACALANTELGHLSQERGRVIAQAAEELAEGRWGDQIVVDAYQGGAGTSTNMNVNEVIANRAIELLGGRKGDYSLVHPLDHVNLHQSTNDVYPTALRVAAIALLLPLSQALARLQEALQEKEAEFAGVIKLGRTEMQDAVPITLGQEFSAWAQAVARDRWRLYKVEERLRQVNLGGTAVGTGLNADRRYSYLAAEKLRAVARQGLSRAENPIDLTQNADVFVEVSGLIKAGAVNLAKIASDLILLSSGPRGGLAEINLPELQAGSSIMPGKVNPVVPEMVKQVSYQVIGFDVAITLAAQGGQLELNAFLPLIAHDLLWGIQLLTRAADIFTERCVKGVTASRERCRGWLEDSYGLVTAIIGHVGYDLASDIAREARDTGRPVRQVILDRGLFTPDRLALVLDPEQMTRPGIPGAVTRTRDVGSDGRGPGRQD